MAAAPTNDPTKARFDYDPTTLQPRGLLIEGSANNLARYSETLEDTGNFWGYNAATRTVESFDVNPTGGTGSISFAPTTDGGSRYAGIFLTGQTTASTYTYSVWLKGKGTTACVISIQSSAGGQNATMTILSQPAGANASIAGNGTGFPRISNLSTTGWTKVQVVLSANLGGTGTLRVFMYPNDTSAQTTTDSLFAWGAQLEAGSGASSYIPTGASQGSRAFDSCVMEDITSLQYSTKTGTMFYAGRFTQMNAASFPNRVGFTRETGDFRTFAALSTTTALLPCFANSGTTVLATQNITLNSELKLAFSFNADLSTEEVKSSLNGGAIVQSGASALTESSVPTYFMFGQKGYGAFFPHGTVRSVKYWPSVLPTAQLQAISTL
jgi:hypothetical protein